MSELLKDFNLLEDFKNNAEIRIKTLGSFSVVRNETIIDSKDWGRDKTLQLLQYFISSRKKNALHKEQIMDNLWQDWNDRDFKC